MLRAGDVVIAKCAIHRYADVKTRPAVVLFEELGNVVIAGRNQQPQDERNTLTGARAP